MLVPEGVVSPVCRRNHGWHGRYFLPTQLLHHCLAGLAARSRPFNVFGWRSAMHRQWKLPARGTEGVHDANSPRACAYQELQRPPYLFKLRSWFDDQG